MIGETISHYRVIKKLGGGMGGVWPGAIAAHCGQKELALRLLRKSLDKSYCQFTGLQNDPLVAPLRGMQEFDRSGQAMQRQLSRRESPLDRTVSSLGV
jgi:hypothetical protein